MSNSRPIDWLESTSRSLSTRFPETKNYSHLLTGRLASLLLERLPEETSQQILRLLPPTLVQNPVPALSTSASSDADHSIGYIDFVKRTASIVGVSDPRSDHNGINSESELSNFSEKLTDAFFWAIAQEFPADLKTRLIEGLPAEICSRMDLYNAQTEESKVG
jgi:hypothetical protein